MLRISSNLKSIVALRGAMRVWPTLRPAEEQSLQNSARILAGILAPYLADLPLERLACIARYIVETVCSTVDRCYPLPADEQAWRLEQLKLTIVAYLGACAE